MPQLLGRTRPFSARLLSLLEAGPANRHCVREMLRLAEGSSTSFSTRLQRVKCNALTGKISSRVQTRKVVYCASNLEVTSVVHLAERLRGPLVNIARTLFSPMGRVSDVDVAFHCNNIRPEYSVGGALFLAGHSDCNSAICSADVCADMFVSDVYLCIRCFTLGSIVNAFGC